MSPLGLSSTLFSLFDTTSTGTSRQAPSAAGSISPTAGSDFSSSLAVRMASVRAQSVNTLIGSAFGNGQAMDAFNFFSGANASANDPLSMLGGSSSASALATGQVSLADPQSAYAMMSLINNKDISYKAQYAELSQMQTAVSAMQQAAQQLSGTDASMSREAITARLSSFVEKYNAWSARFESSVQNGGILDGTQAAEVSLQELEQSVENIFNGAADGIHGLRDLGIAINRDNNTASFDTSKLDAALASNQQGVINAINQFSANFSKSAELLNSANNLIPNRLGNLDRVIHYIDGNLSSLQSEFGSGAPAKVSPQLAKALQTYNQIYAS